MEVSPMAPPLQDYLTGLPLGLKNHKATITMSYQILTEVAASISELKANPMKTVASGEGMPIAVLNRNEPAFYCVPAKAYEAMMDLIEDKELLALAKSRMDEESVKVSLDDL
jgi:antitoxin StbD